MIETSQLKNTFFQMGNKTIFLMEYSKRSWLAFVVWVLLICCLFLFKTNIQVIYLSNNKNSFVFRDSFSPPVSKNIHVSIHGVEKQVETDTCVGRYIYVHDLPSRFNEDFIKNCSGLIKWYETSCPFVANMGLGLPVTKPNGVLQGSNWFLTNQFMLEIIFHNRMKQYKCLTKNSSLASAIYVPFYAGLDIGRYLWGFDTPIRDLAPDDLISWLTKKPEWKYMNGKDHFLVAGRVTWDFRRQTDRSSDWGNKLFQYPQSQNMTFLIIESCTWCRKIEMAIPYPSFFHPSSDLDVYKWQDKVMKEKRQYLYSFVGATRPKGKASIRNAIIEQCLPSKEKCNWFDCNARANNCDDPIQVMRVFQSSIFCLQPSGDSPTRRSTFDSMIGGCIPVFFKAESAYTQYLWHLPKDTTKYSVFIPENDIKNKMANIEGILSAISEEEVIAMREEVVRLIPKISYSNPIAKFENVEDAFDVAIKGVIEKVEETRREIKEKFRSMSFHNTSSKII